MTDKKDEKPGQISDADLKGVQGGAGKGNRILKPASISNDTIFTASSNDTIFSGTGDDITSFNIGMPPRKK